MSTPDQTDRGRGRLAVRLLQLHARQQRALEAQRRRLAEQTGRLAARMLGSAEPGSGAWPALEAAAAIARDLPSGLRSAIAERLPSPLADEFLASVYSFESLPLLEQRKVERIIRKADKHTLAIALLGAPEPVHAAVTLSMSSRAAEMLREDMEHLLASGDLHTSDVREARAAIASIIRESL